MFKQIVLEKSHPHTNCHRSKDIQMLMIDLVYIDLARYLALSLPAIYPVEKHESPSAFIKNSFGTMKIH